MADQMESAPLAAFVSAALPGFAAFLVAAALCLFHFARHYQPGIVSPDAMDTVQAARYLARTGDLGTNVIRPLLTQSLTIHGDGTLPDLAHPPLHLALCALLMRLTHHTFYGVGDQDAALVSVICFLGSIAACYALFVRCFGHRGALWSCLLYAMGGTALTAALSARPTLLAGFLFTTLLITLVGVDQAVPKATGHPEEGVPSTKRATALWAIVAGLVYGLLYLSVYSSLVLLPPLLVYIWLISGRRSGPAFGFLLATLLITAPLLWHNWRATGFPFYNTRLIEVVMNTETFPGYSLYRASAAPIPLGQYLGQGGVAEILRKAGNNLLGFYGRLPNVWGGFLLTLTLGSLLTRFADPRVNRLRSLLWVCVGMHVLGLSLFQGFEETTPLLLMYAPAASVIGVGFLLSVVRSRNLPRFYRQSVVIGWMTIGSVPGILQLVSHSAPASPVSGLYLYLNNESAEMQALRPSRRVYLVSDAPWELAFRCDYPAVWLPQNGDVMATVAQRTGHPLDGVTLTGDVNGYEDDDVNSWKLLYRRLTSVSQLVGGVDAPTRESIRRQLQVYYPQDLSAALNTFAPLPQMENNGLSYSLILWNPQLTRAVKAGKVK